MKVEVTELRRIATRLFDLLEARGIHSVALNHDHYWSVPSGSRYDVYQEPKTLEIGQLSSDLQSLRELDDPDEPAVAFGFVWLSTVLREIGEQEVG